MNRKDYQKPTMKVVKLQQKCHILVGSDGQAGVENYNMNNVDEE